MDKKAFMKTVEVFMAIIVTFTFVLVFLPREVPDVDDQSIFRLRNIDVDEDFRNCVLAENSACINATIDGIFAGRFFYDYEIYGDGESSTLVVDEDEVRTFSWFFAGNHTSYAPKTFKLYYWVPTAK